jgi:hypothetical protein
MERARGTRRFVAMGALTALVGFGTWQSMAMGSQSDTQQNPRVANVGIITTQDFRVAVVARPPRDRDGGHATSRRFAGHRAATSLAVGRLRSRLLLSASHSLRSVTTPNEPGLSTAFSA